MSRKTEAFTLVDLLVSVAVIALLMAILMPALAQVQVVKKDYRCKTQVRVVVQGVVGFALERNKLPEVPFLNYSTFWLNVTDEPATVMLALHGSIGPWIDPAEDAAPGVFTRPWCCELDAHGFWERTGVSYAYDPCMSPYLTFRRYERNPLMSVYRDAKAQTNRVMNVGRFDGSVTGE